MITAYVFKENLQALAIFENNASLLNEALWVDVLDPSRDEEKLLEKTLTLNIPTREEMHEIESSSRLYKEHNALFMTAPMIAQSASPNPEHDPISFVLSPTQLITVRYIEPQAFQLFIKQLSKIDLKSANAVSLLIQLLEATVDRLADILEIVGHYMEEYSKTIFRPPSDVKTASKLNYQLLIQQVGANADLNTKARECLVGFSRLIQFFGQSACDKISTDNRQHLDTLSKDISSLSDHASFLSTKVNFLLDATLGMINIEQNAIIKIFSVAAVIFLPPTLIASIYGMNFHFMPELSYKHGYIMALTLMVLSALLPYKFFKHKHWL